MTSQPPISAPPPVPPPYGPPPYGPPLPGMVAYQNIPTTRQTSVMAVISFVAGLTWWFWLGSVVAVVLGHMARAEIREQGQGGDTLAIFGLIFGYIGLATAGAMFFMTVLGAATYG